MAMNNYNSRDKNRQKSRSCQQIRGPGKLWFSLILKWNLSFLSPLPMFRLFHSKREDLIWARAKPQYSRSYNVKWILTLWDFVVPNFYHFYILLIYAYRGMPITLTLIAINDKICTCDARNVNKRLSSHLSMSIHLLILTSSFLTAKQLFPGLFTFFYAIF